MTRTLLLTVFAVAGFATNSFAQITANANATTALNVVAGISILQGANVNFGTIAQGQGTVTLGNTGGITGSNIIGTQTGTAGKFSVAGAPNATFSVNASATTLTGPGTAITFTPTLYGNATDTPGSASTVTSGTLSGTGAYFLYVGGSLAVAASQATGTYNGSVTVTVDYTSL